MPPNETNREATPTAPPKAHAYRGTRSEPASTAFRSSGGSGRCAEEDCSAPDLSGDEEVRFDGRTPLCRRCHEFRITTFEELAEEFAFEHVEVLSDPPSYSQWSKNSDGSKPTPEAYARGEVRCFTRNAYHAHLRHQYTNYDRLLYRIGQYRGTCLGDALYRAIRSRISELFMEMGVEFPEYGDRDFG